VRAKGVEGAVYSGAASSVQSKIERTFVMFALIFSQPSEACGCALRGCCSCSCAAPVLLLNEHDGVGPHSDGGQLGRRLALHGEY
jgi:hypothetical protein